MARWPKVATTVGRCAVRSRLGATPARGSRHAETLVPVKSIKDGPVRLLVAAKVGKTRLIDNVGVETRDQNLRSSKRSTAGALG